MIRFALGIFCLITAAASLEDPTFARIDDGEAWVYFSWFTLIGLSLIAWALIAGPPGDRH
jgi:hypothetical protein